MASTARAAATGGGLARERRLFLIDGPSLVYRAFYALPESIATSTGEPTNAIFGFASMLVKLLSECGPCPTIVAWDAGTSGRTELYPEYKAQRIKRPDLLKQQWPAIAPLVQALGYRNIIAEGYEADDVIATLAEKARAAKVPVTIVTGDRDVFQLIDEDGLVEVMATARGITETKTYDRDAVIERYGIPPEAIPDFYGLKGDTSDNIPGVDGIGEKTAGDLIKKYGSLEGVLSHISEIGGPKRRRNLLDHAENARISKRLATVNREVPLDFDPVAELAVEPDRSGAREAFRLHELRDPLRRLEEALGDESLPVASADEQAIAATLKEGASLADIAGLKGEPLCLAAREAQAPEGELFTTGKPWRFAAAADGRVLAGECDGPAELVAACAQRGVIAHDAKALDEVPPNLEHDTLIGAYLLEPARRGYPLAELCEERGFVASLQRAGGRPKGEAARDGARAEGAGEQPGGGRAKAADSQPDATLQSAASDAVLVGALASWQRQEIEARGLTRVMNEIELPLIPVLREIERLGVRINLQRLAEITQRVRSEIAQLEREIFNLAGTEFLIASTQQLGEVLFVKLGLSRKRRGKTGFSTDARVLQAIRDEHPIVPKVERWRELSTLIKTYLDVLPQMTDAQSRIHTTFLQAVAQTGRLSSTNPNMQNVPIRTELGREIRGCFEAEQGSVLISADYSQIELRVLANVANEQVLMEIFEQGEDVHTATASRVFGVSANEIDPGMRSKAKMINYGIVYGLSDYGLSDRLNIPLEEAKAFIDAYLQRFPKVASFIALTIEHAKDKGHVTTLWGRRRQVPELKARNFQVRSLGERLAVNTVVQGTAADIIKLAMLRCHAALASEGMRTRLILTIHDELLFECPTGEVDAAKALIEREMCGVWDLEPPLAVDIGVGENWLAAK